MIFANIIKKLRAKKICKLASSKLEEKDYKGYFSLIEQAVNLGDPLAQHFILLLL